MSSGKITDDVRFALRSLEDAHGRLATAKVIAAARKSGSPLHAFFTWDREQAHQKLLLIEARELIRSVHVPLALESGELQELPAYVSDPASGAGESIYVKIEQLRSEPENAAALVAYEVATALGHLRRAEGLAKTLDVRGQLQQIKLRLEKFAKLLDRKRAG